MDPSRTSLLLCLGGSGQCLVLLSLHSDDTSMALWLRKKHKAEQEIASRGTCSSQGAKSGFKVVKLGVACFQGFSRLGFRNRCEEEPDRKAVKV